MTRANVATRRRTLSSRRWWAAVGFGGCVALIQWALERVVIEPYWLMSHPMWAFRDAVPILSGVVAAIAWPNRPMRASLSLWAGAGMAACLWLTLSVAVGTALAFWLDGETWDWTTRLRMALLGIKDTAAWSLASVSLLLFFGCLLVGYLLHDDLGTSEDLKATDNDDAIRDQALQSKGVNDRTVVEFQCDGANIRLAGKFTRIWPFYIMPVGRFHAQEASNGPIAPKANGNTRDTM